MKISVSFLSDKYNNADLLDKINKTNADYIHVDVMDNVFVNNKNMLYEDACKLKDHFKKKLDVHLMVKDLDKFINEFSLLKPEYITFHIEATDDVFKYIKLIKEKNIKCGLSINPSTNVNKLYRYLSDIDLVLIMGVVPGASGQKFNEKVLKKIKIIKERIISNKYNCIISIDGGINDKTSKLCKEAGVDMIVSASYLHEGDMNKKIDILRS